MNFGERTKVTKVATQGRQDGAWWVKSYCLSYSYDGVFFEDYKEDGFVKVFYDHFLHIASTCVWPSARLAVHKVQER